MSTTVLDAYSKAYPSIANRLKASVYKEDDLLSPIATIIEVGAHLSRIWHFPGLPRANYAFSLDEINGGGVAINNLAFFDVVPGSIEGSLVRKDEQIQVGVTPGFVAGTQTATFDGTAGAPNYIGWDIVPSELTGRGILVRGLDYSWDSITGIIVWLQAGDLLPNAIFYNIHFNPNVTTAGGSEPTISDFSTRIIDADDSILVEDFGNNIICEPGGIFITIQLPDISTVPQGRILRVETIKALGSAVQCVHISPFEGDIINWLRGKIWMMNNEDLELYRFRRPDLSNEWRVRSPNGNFKTVGNSVGEDMTQGLGYCRQLFDGSIKNRYQYSRIYEEIVLNLPGTQVVHYDDWATGNNKYLFSLADSANPANADKFHFPDRRDLYERNNNTEKAGDRQTSLMKQFWTDVVGGIPSILSVTGSNTEIGVDPGAGSPDIKNQRLINTTLFGTEVRPETYLINKYCLI